MSTKRVRFSVSGKLASLLLFLSLTAFVGVLCIKPISSGAIKDAFIDTALSDRVTDVIYEMYPQVTTEQLGAVEKFVDSNPVVDDLVEKYLVAATNGGNFDVSGNEELFDGFNEDLLDETTGELGITLTDEQKQTVMEKLKSQEEQVNNAVRAEVENLSDTNNKVKTALKLYGIATSTTVVAGCGALTAALALMVILLRQGKIRFMNNLGISAILSGAIIGAGIPAGIWLFGDDLTNRFLGRTVQVDAKICMELGALLAATGIVFLLLRAIVCVIGRRSLAR